jgi:hypothetical protein
MLWLVVGSLGMELKWQRKELEDINMNFRAKEKRLRYEISQLRHAFPETTIVQPPVSSIGLY